MSEFEIASCIICDDVRLEANGKQIIVGVYPGDIIIAKQPNADSAPLTFAVWFEISVRDTGVHKFGFKIDIGEKEVFLIDSLEAHIDAKYNLVMPLGPITLPVQASAELKIYIRMDQRKWRVSKVKKVNIIEAKPIQTPSIAVTTIPGPL